MIDRLLAGWFPHLPDQSQYNRRLRRLAPWICTVQLQVAELVAEGEIRLVDGTLITCANYPGCQSKSRFAGDASYGYCPSKSRFVWGMRLVLMSDIKGTRSAMTSSDPRPQTNASLPGSWPARSPAATCSPTAASGAPSTNAP